MYAVAGVTGNTGAAVADALLAAGERVRVIVRRDAGGAPWRARGAEVAVAALDDAPALAAALRGCAGLYWLNPPAYGEADVFAMAAARARVLRAALAEAGVGRAVVLSSVGAHQARGTGIIRTSHVVEAGLAGIAAPVAFLRGRYFFENWGAVLGAARGDGVLPSFLGPADRPIDMVTAPDIGAAAVALLRGPAWTGARRIELASFTASPAAVAAALGAALGRAVAPVIVPREQWAGVLAGAGFAPPVVEAFVAMYDGILAGVVAPEPGAERATGQTGLAAAAAALAG